MSLLVFEFCVMRPSFSNWATLFRAHVRACVSLDCDKYVYSSRYGFKR